MPTIDEAIKNITLWGEETEEVDEGDFSDAVQLSLEALKCVQRCPRWITLVCHDLLPGETEK